MDLSGLLIIAGCTIAIVVLVWRGVRSRTGLRRLLAGGPLRPLHAVRAGRVYVQGRVSAATQLTAPLSGEHVIGYRVLVERRDGQSEWTRLVDHTEVTDFEMHEETGAALVCGEDAVLLITEEAGALPLLEAQLHDKQRRSQLPRLVVALLQAHCHYTPAEHEAARMRWSEFQLVEGGQVYVVGEATVTLARDGRLSHGGAAYRATPTRTQIKGSARRPLLICDRSRESLASLLATVGAERYLPRRILERS
jgi:hypothetical protein